MTTTTTTPCRLCGAEAPFFLSHRVLRRHEVGYFRCPQCDLIQTEPPYWLEEAYSSAITALDTGAVSRNVFCTRLALTVGLAVGADAGAPCLDYGGGHGVFTRMMRDAGWNFHWADRYAANHYARGFEGKPAWRYCLVTAFEVLEHLADVQAELALLFGPGHDFILVSTLLHRNPDAEWWYWVPETGQHVAFYSARTLAHVAERFGYEVICGRAYALFVRKDEGLSWWRRALLRPVLRWPAVAYGVGSLLAEGRRPWSLTWGDHVALRDAAGTKNPTPQPPPLNGEGEKAG